MKRILFVMLVAICILVNSAIASPDINSTAYLFSFNDINGKKVKLSDFEGKVILVVNTASQCIFTPQYARLQSLYNTYKDRGLVIIAVPSPDFGNQEFADKAKIKAFTHDKYAVTFKVMSPTHVTGNQAHPFYIWASQKFGVIATPKWNFHKYLINKNGELVDWFSSTTSPDSSRVKRAIEKNLK